MSPQLARAARVVVGLGILAVVLAGVDPTSVAEALAGTDVPLVVLGVVGLTAAHLVPATGWRAILATTTGFRLSWRAAIGLYYASQAIGGVTPANIGGDVHRAGSLRRSGHDWSTAVAPLFVQRATSYLALTMLASVALVFLTARTPVAGDIVLAGVAAAAITAIASGLLLAPPGLMRALRDRLIGFSGAAPVALRDAVLVGIGHGLVFHALGIGLTAVIVLAVEPAAPVGAVLAGLAVARLALAVPITPSGLGVQEGAAAVIFGAMGLAPSVALGGLLLARLSLLLTTLIGVALLQRRDVVAPPRTAPHAPNAH